MMYDYEQKYSFDKPSYVVHVCNICCLHEVVVVVPSWTPLFLLKGARWPLEW